MLSDLSIAPRGDFLSFISFYFPVSNLFFPLRYLHSNGMLRLTLLIFDINGALSYFRCCEVIHYIRRRTGSKSFNAKVLMVQKSQSSCYITIE